MEATLTRLERIERLERLYDEALSAIDNLDAALDVIDNPDENMDIIEGKDEALAQFKAALPLMEELTEYYESGLWREDYLADEAGELPPDLKRGILSEDGIYNMITDMERLKDEIL